jgi:hypothetical protein
MGYKTSIPVMTILILLRVHLRRHDAMLSKLTWETRFTAQFFSFTPSRSRARKWNAWKNSYYTNKTPEIHALNMTMRHLTKKCLTTSGGRFCSFPLALQKRGCKFCAHISGQERVNLDATKKKNVFLCHSNFHSLTKNRIRTMHPFVKIIKVSFSLVSN